MRNKQVDKKLSKAISLIKTWLEESDTTGVTFVQEEYKSYISSFGPTLNSCGVLPAVALYLNLESSSVASKPELIWCLFNLADIQDLPERESKSVKIETLARQMLEITIHECEKDQRSFRYKLETATVAMKLALRTFNLQRKKQ